jgi:DNA polymerase III alpha subunit
MRIVHTLPTPVDVRAGKKADSLRRIAEEGLGRKFSGAVPEAVKTQLAWELQWITLNRCVGQYLMLRDILMKAKELRIPVSPGNGRVGNSVLAYALGLCEPDPYAYGLVIAESSHIFIGAFGINVSADRAHELINYVKAQYAVDDRYNRSLDLIELPALDLLQAVVERACVPGDHGFWSSVPLDDPKTYNLLGAGDTDGVYQLDTDDAKKYLRAWRPATFTDLLVLTTLNWCVSEALIPEVIKRAHGKGSVPYSDPLLATVTAESFGFMIWQEQVIGALTALAGLDGDSAYRVLRILWKRMAGPVVEAQDRFISACVSRMNVPENRAQAVWFELDIYSAKVRSKAHAVAHGLLTYRMAYLKAHWRKAFDAALLAGK